MYYSQAFEEYQRENSIQTIDLINEAIRINPSESACYYLRATIYERLRQNEKALVDFTECIKLDPTNVAHYNSRASLFVLLNRYEEAYEDLKKAQSIDPKAMLLDYYMNMVEEKLGIKKD